jgi:hypothetical protein
MRTRLALLVGAVALLALPAAAGASPLAGYWPMYEGKGQVVHDISGNHNDGRLGSSRSTDGRDADWVDGLLGVGDALRFDGNDYIAIPDAKSLHPQRLTVEAWAKRAGSPGAYKYIVSKGGDGCEAASYGLYSSYNGGIAFYIYDGKKWYRSPSAAEMAPLRRDVRRHEGAPVRRQRRGRHRDRLQRQDQVRLARRRRRHRRVPRRLQADAERHRRRGADLVGRAAGRTDLVADQLGLGREPVAPNAKQWFARGL